MTTYYKTFRAGRIGPHSGVKWPKRIGAWVAVEGPLALCENGIHVARGEAELVDWLSDEVYEVEVRGERIDSDSKACVRECRLVRRVETLNDRTLRLFAADCAERALSRVASPDPRSVEAVRVARLFAEGGATESELAAAGDAAWAAAWDAAGDAAWAAAGDAAWAAAWDAAGDAEREWQAQRLRYYINGEKEDA